MSEFKLDFSDFAKKFENIAKKLIPLLAEKGVARAGLQLLNDCVMQVPTVPLKTGFLRGSGSVFVQNKLVGVSSYGKPGGANTEYSGEIKPGDITATCGFNTSYCARLHESVGFTFSESSSGPKFLESKLVSNKEIYMQIVANTIKEAGDKRS